ncbi:MAG TPA: hypothetical protein VGW12_19945 [Pyrinomonadaceae bacterium]|nr:hypothetical protein [Pyrinomonadaceae bacterium]
MSRRVEKWCLCALLAALLCAASAMTVAAQRRAQAAEDEEFGPVVRTYLGYLRAEQEVVDDRASRHEVSPAYYRRNSNRIRALRQVALRIARETQNDFLPELYAVTRDELGTLFDPPPSPTTFRIGEVVNDTFRYLGPVRVAESFYIFARLDVYEQAELMKQHEGQPATVNAAAATGGATADEPTRPNRPATTRPRRVHIP